MLALDNKIMRINGFNSMDIGSYTITVSLFYNDTISFDSSLYFNLEVLEAEVKVLNVISSEFDLLPKKVATLKPIPGQDFTQVVESLANLKD